MTVPGDGASSNPVADGDDAVSGDATEGGGAITYSQLDDDLDARVELVGCRCRAPR